MTKEHTAECMNILGEFCGIRDVPELTPEALKRRFGIRQADVMVLFGGSILCGGDVLAAAMKEHVAKKYVIVGGAGHTTETLRVKMHEAFPEIETGGLPEAKVFEKYIAYRYGLHADFLECRSTNCGNNITYLLDLLKENRITFQNMILTQDASMQRRMDAGLRKYMPELTIINFSAYKAKVTVAPKAETVVSDGSRAEGLEGLRYEKDIWGMWDIERYLTLLMGEIPRLSDDENGYGPKGKDYIAHVDIPEKVEQAFWELKQVYGSMVREANPRFASSKAF